MAFLQSFFGQDTKIKGKINSILDAVNYAAGLASNPTDIDELLDTVRSITAQQSEGELNAADQQRLADVYIGIERYLTSSDPLRTFNKQEVRARLDEQVLQKVSEREGAAASRTRR